MFFQKFLIFLAFLGLVVLVQAENGSSSTVTVKSNIYSTEVVSITKVGEPPAVTKTTTESPVYSIYTNVRSSDTASVTNVPVSPSGSHSNSSATASPSNAPTSSGANSLKMSAGLGFALVVVYAAML